MPAIGASTTGGSATTRSDSRSGRQGERGHRISTSGGRVRRAAEVALDPVERDALLRHRVALAHGDGVVVEGVEVDGDAERRADLVLAAVALADAPACRRTRRSSAGAARAARSRAFGERSALRDSGSTATLTGARRRSSRSTVRFSITPLALGASSSV